jgi:hypothetical protein
MTKISYLLVAEKVEIFSPTKGRKKTVQLLSVIAMNSNAIVVIALKEEIDALFPIIYYFCTGTT